MKSSIKYSIVVATANDSNDLDNMLESLLTSKILNRKDVEVIIVNNRKQFESHVKKICQKYQVKYLLETKVGQSPAQNTGIENAVGEYIVFTDDDALITDPFWLVKMSAHFDKNPLVGYVSGNVKAFTTKSEVQSAWEKKGGLSKGEKFVHYDRKFFSKFRLSPWPMNKMAAGCNSMFKRQFFKDHGLLIPFMTTGTWFTNGDILEIVYRIAKNGYEVIYDPSIVVYHKHPEDPKALLSRMYIYGTGNSGYQMYIFVKYGDFRSLWWGLLGHHVYVLRRIIKRLFGLFPMPLPYLVQSLRGSLTGTYLFIKNYHQYKQFIFDPKYGK